MAHVYSESVTITTAADGSATEYIGSRSDGKALNGKILSMIYTKDDFTDGVDFTITSETTAQTIWTESNVNASETIVPMQAAYTTAGVAALVYNDGTRTVPLYAPVYLAHERIKIVIASGGNATSGTFRAIIEQNE